MFGISYGELFLILGATAALIGPKDLPVVARTAGRLAGRAIGYVQLARGQFENIMQQSEASKVHKELRDTLAQIEAIRYEMRSISHMNPDPFIRRLDGGETRAENGCEIDMKPVPEHKPTAALSKDINKENSVLKNLHNQAIGYEKIAEAVKSTAVNDATKLVSEGLLTVLPVCAETAKLLPKRTCKYHIALHAVKIAISGEVVRESSPLKNEFSDLRRSRVREDRSGDVGQEFG